MTSTLNKEFSDFCASRDAQNTLQLNVTKWTWMLCDALRQNFIDYSIRSHQLSKESKDDDYGYNDACIQKLKNGICDYNFIFETGRKYHKILVVNESGGCSSHCFIDKKTGEVYMSASFKSPAKGVRYDLRLIQEREWLLKNADWAGGYLYKK